MRTTRFSDSGGSWSAQPIDIGEKHTVAPLRPRDGRGVSDVCGPTPLDADIPGGRPAPPVNRMTDASKTLPCLKLRLRAVIILFIYFRLQVFFYRNIKRVDLLGCEATRSCQPDPNFAFSCAACRMTKCLASGMTLEGKFHHCIFRSILIKCT